jgi:hypothetical protein
MRVLRPEQVPEFSGIIDFARWYIANGMPLKPPAQQEVFLSDDASATCLFRHGRYQVEMYLIHPQPVIPFHEHPGVENIEVSQSHWSTLTDDQLEQFVQRSGQGHGGDFRVRAGHSGFALISAQKWDEGIPLSTIGARWRGHTAGPKHEAIIRRFNPGCLVIPGYADVTQRATTVTVL